MISDKKAYKLQDNCAILDALIMSDVVLIINLQEDEREPSNHSSFS